jgi:membrane-bound lytic murein transglycosylase B
LSCKFLHDLSGFAVRNLYWQIGNNLGRLSRRRGFFFILVFLWLWPQGASASWSPLIDRLVADGFDEQGIRYLFSRPEVSFEPGGMSSKLEALIKNQSRKPREAFPYQSKGVYKGALKRKMISQARSYLQENKGLLERISRQYCVPKEIIVSILLVESRLGEFLGGKTAFNSLASMALCADLETIHPYLPPKLITAENEEFARAVCLQKAEWAYRELKALILYAHYAGFDPLSLPGSIYGAIGLCQFMPTNALTYGVDADNDGRVDLFVKADALHSIANYLKEHGWSCRMDRASQRKVVYAYNHSNVYANTVLAVAEKLKAKSKKK